MNYINYLLYDNLYVKLNDSFLMIDHINTCAIIEVITLHPVRVRKERGPQNNRITKKGNEERKNRVSCRLSQPRTDPMFRRRASALPCP